MIEVYIIMAVLAFLAFIFALVVQPVEHNKTES